MGAGYKITESEQGVLYEDSVENVLLSLPHGSACVDFRTVDEPKAEGFGNMMARAMSAPYGTPRLSALARGKSSVSIIVSDSWPLGLLDWL